MTGLFKCIVFSCGVSLIFGFTSVRDDALWFKNGERIKSRFVTGVVNGIVDFHCSEAIYGQNIEGECLSKVECMKAGGKVGGLCSLLGSCCHIEKTCSQTASSKVSYFVPPVNFQTDCSLNVNIYSKDVCQIRLDFEKFDIAQPKSKTKVEGGQSYNTSFQCYDDSFKVENAGKYLGFPHLCGRNNGQHIYIPVSDNQRPIALHFHFKDRNESNSTLPQPQWRIKIRQLECGKSGYEQHLNAPSKLLSMYNSLKNKKYRKSDYELIAPPNCLQYYPNKTGTFESFNYNEGRGCYIGRLDYAICFRKTPEICSARYTANGVFQMNQNTDEEDNDCHPQREASPTVSQDYLRIPGGIDSADNFRDYYCDGHFFNNIITAKSFEPLYVGVHTDKYRANSGPHQNDAIEYEEVGFRIRYELSSGKCDNEF